MKKNPLIVEPLAGEIGPSVEVPGDKSISHRVAILAGYAEGVSKVKNFLPSEDCLNTLEVMKALGAEVETLSWREELPVDFSIKGVGGKLKQPDKNLDCGNSGTGMRLLAGFLAGQSIESCLIGDSSLQSRPMNRIIKPLSQMGAVIDAQGDKEGCAPLAISGRELQGTTYELPVASAQVKSAILLAGLSAQGRSTVIQPVMTRDHTEKVFPLFGINCEVDGFTVSIAGPQLPTSTDFVIPGDFSSAAFWIVLAAIRPNKTLEILNVGLNPSRIALLNVIKRMGAQIEIISKEPKGGEPVGDLKITGAPLQGVIVELHEIPNLIDEIPILAIAAARATGVTSIRNASELRVKETDRITAVVENLKKIGGTVREFDDGMEIKGQNTPFLPAQIKTWKDHRIAMSFAIAALFAKAPIEIDEPDSIATSYPGFISTLQSLSRGKAVNFS